MRNMFVVLVVLLHFFNNSHAMVIRSETKPNQSHSVRTDRQFRPIVNGFLYLLFANLLVKGVLGLNALNTAPQSPAIPTNINGSLFFSFGNQATPPPLVSQQQIQPQQFTTYQPVLVLNRGNTLTTTQKPTLHIAQQQQHVLNIRDQHYDDEDYELFRHIHAGNQFGLSNRFYYKKPKRFEWNNMLYDTRQSSDVTQERKQTIRSTFDDGLTQISSNTINYLVPNVFEHSKAKHIDELKTPNILQNRYTKINLATNHIINYLTPIRNNEKSQQNMLYDMSQNRKDALPLKSINYLTPATNDFYNRVKHFDMTNMLYDTKQFRNSRDKVTLTYEKRPINQQTDTKFKTSIKSMQPINIGGNLYGKKSSRLQNVANEQVSTKYNTKKYPKYGVPNMFVNNKKSENNIDNSIHKIDNTEFDLSDINQNVADFTFSNDRVRRDVEPSKLDFRNISFKNKYVADPFTNEVTGNVLRGDDKTGKQLDLTNILDDAQQNVTNISPTGLEMFNNTEENEDDIEFGRQRVNATTTTTRPATVLPEATTSMNLVSNVTDSVSNTTYDPLGYGPPNGNENINITYPDGNNTNTNTSGIYGPPTNIYGPPTNIYGPPTNIYGPPNNLYGPPNNIYTPIDLSNTYGAPVYSKPILPGFYPSSSGFYPSFNNKNPFGTFDQKPYGFETKYPNVYSPNTFSSFPNQFPSSFKFNSFGSGYGYEKPGSGYPFNLFKK